MGREHLKKTIHRPLGLHYGLLYYCLIDVVHKQYVHSDGNILAGNGSKKNFTIQKCFGMSL